MPQFAKRKTQPLRPDSYRRLARLIRDYADTLDRVADPQTPHERKSRTQAMSGLHRLVHHHWLRHRGTTPGDELHRLIEQERNA